MRYDPAVQASMADPMAWATLMLVVALVVVVTVIAVFAALSLARRESGIGSR
jgi:hypothetical protein